MSEEVKASKTHVFKEQVVAPVSPKLNKSKIYKVGEAVPEFLLKKEGMDAHITTKLEEKKEAKK